VFGFLIGVVTACGGGSSGQDVDPNKNDQTNDAPSGGGLETGTLDVQWMHGSADCTTNTEPELQHHAYNATTHILRQNKCDTFEAPFIYVLIGQRSALVLDTGGTRTTTLRDKVRELVGDKPLLVAHSHAHGDHVASDAKFADQPLTTVIGRTPGAVQTAFGIETWPTSAGSHDLGGRMLDVLAVPGHEASHIVIYDRNTGLLLTGDHFYPGMLFINDWETYRTSHKRLAQFVAAHPIAHVLGAHVEMSSTPKVEYPYMTTFQPEEHVLELTAAHVAELDAALDELGPTKPEGPVKHDDFIIDPQ
jgi:hydroxyacylglutathione hydrolase